MEVHAEENLKNVEQVLLRLKQCGDKVKKGKCVFLAKTIEYLGYRVDQSRLHTLDSKVPVMRYKGFLIQEL